MSALGQQSPVLTHHLRCMFTGVAQAKKTNETQLFFASTLMERYFLKSHKPEKDFQWRLVMCLVLSCGGDVLLIE